MSGEMLLWSGLQPSMTSRGAVSTQVMLRLAQGGSTRPSVRLAPERSFGPAYDISFEEPTSAEAFVRVAGRTTYNTPSSSLRATGVGYRLVWETKHSTS